jgi:5-methylthioadenosine/S-adenosylhomocysteine deaminase
MGALGPDLLLAHCVWLDPSDLQLLAESGTHVAHCPHSNLKLASGVAPIPELLAQGGSVGLGSDGVKSNNSVDLFEVMKLTSLLHKGTHLDATLLGASEVISLATRAGAQIVGIDAGSIAPGQLADLTLVDLSPWHMQPAIQKTLQANLVHAAKGSDVRTVIVEGEIVVQDGQLTQIDATAIKAQVAEAGRRLVEQVY